LRRVVLIRAAQSLGFTLREIKELIGVGRSQVGCAELQSAVDVKLEDIDRRISALQQTRRRLKAVRRSCSGGRELCPAVARIGQSGRREQSSLA
jgi:DNA-binding transcriptional MerR regulator